jgi:FtsP/CotA-like multicopper oxidase with cupredoxin domain
MYSRRDFLKLSAAAAGRACAAGAQNLPAAPQAPDYRLEIAPVTLDLSPRQKLKTVAYNGQAPGPLLRLKEGEPVTIEIANRTTRPEVVHWHGLFLPPQLDGALEEGTPAIAPGAATRITFTPSPAGFRWYHTHTTSMHDLEHGQFSGQHGPLLIEPRQHAGRYDQELFVTLHDWDPYLTGNEDGAMNPTYRVSTINGKVLGAGEPLRVRVGTRTLLHVLNSSPTEVHWLSLSGHEFTVVALDGNTLAAARPVPMLRLAPAERVCAMIAMDRPGVWVLGEVRKHVQAQGMGIVVEYAGQSGAPRWQQPEQLLWSYEPFASPELPQASTSVISVPLVIESRFRGHGAMEDWLINGKSFPESGIAPLIRGQRYRLQFINKSKDDHPLHLHRHLFQLRRLGVPLDSRAPAPAEIAGPLKDVVLVDAETQAEVEFTADHPGATLLHCHQQDHMDHGFMMLLHYA